MLAVRQEQKTETAEVGWYFHCSRKWCRAGCRSCSARHSGGVGGDMCGGGSGGGGGDSGGGGSVGGGI